VPFVPSIVESLRLQPVGLGVIAIEMIISKRIPIKRMGVNPFSVFIDLKAIS
jgi:hypothetical protein